MMKIRQIILLLVLLSMAFSASADDGIMRLHLIWTNDVHGHVAPEEARFMNPAFPPPLGGGASSATYVKSVRALAQAEGGDILILDAGDTFQGTPVGTKTQGRAMTAYFNELGYDAIVPGNHEFDLGREIPERMANNSDMPWICANLREESTGEIVDWCQPTIMLEKAGMKIGIIGIITPGTVHMAFPDNIAGLIFDPMKPAIEKYRDELRSQGAEIVVLLIHEGLPFDAKAGWAQIASEEAQTSQDAQGGGYGHVKSGGMNLMELMHVTHGIDFAIGGHTHRGYHGPWIDPLTHTLCFESFGNGSSIGHAILKIDRSSGTIIGYDKPHDRGTLVTLFEDEIWPDAEMAAVLRPYIEKTEAAMNIKVGSSAVNLTRGGPGSSLMGNFVTDAMLAYFDADFSFQNVGGLRSDLPAGDLTVKDVFSVLPFGNELVLVEMDGAMVRKIIERKVRGNSGGLCIAGVNTVFNKTREDWDRVCRLELNGEPVLPGNSYKVVCTTYLMEGNSGLDFLTTIPAGKIELTQITTSETVEHYLKENSPVRPKIDNRWVEDPQAEQADYLKK
jgi:5'-nucleotidase / UDP-sugar diphosphatase